MTKHPSSTLGGTSLSGVVGGALADGERRNELRVHVERDPQVLIPDARVVAFAVMELPLLLLDERPLFIEFQVMQFQAAHLLIEEVPAGVPELNQNLQDRRPVNPRHAADRPQGYAFDKVMDDADLIVYAQNICHDSLFPLWARIV